MFSLKKPHTLAGFEPVCVEKGEIKTLEKNIFKKLTYFI
jgi:hypothetical protein